MGDRYETEHYVHLDPALIGITEPTFDSDALKVALRLRESRVQNRGKPLSGQRQVQLLFVFGARVLRLAVEDSPNVVSTFRITDVHGSWGAG